MAASHMGDIVHLNVGGTRFSTSRQTLSWIPDSFFTALLSNRIASRKDENGALFIDRDPTIFSIILNYLRTRDIDLRNVDIRALRHEAEYYGITPLVKRLMLCEDLSQSPCGDVLFYGYLPPPSIPLQEPAVTSTNVSDVSVHGSRPAPVVTSSSNTATVSTNTRSDPIPSTSQGAVASTSSANPPTSCNSTIINIKGTSCAEVTLTYRFFLFMKWFFNSGFVHTRDKKVDILKLV